MDKHLAKIAALIITKRMWKSDFLTLAELCINNGIPATTTDIGEAWDIFLSYID